MNSDIKETYKIKTTDKETLLKWYHFLRLGRSLDDRAPNYLKQAIGWSYHAPAAGHDAIQLAIGQVFDRSKDHLCYICIFGNTIKDNFFSSKTSRN